MRLPLFISMLIIEKVCESATGPVKIIDRSNGPENIHHRFRQVIYSLVIRMKNFEIRGVVVFKSTDIYTAVIVYIAYAFLGSR